MTGHLKNLRDKLKYEINSNKKEFSKIAGYKIHKTNGLQIHNQSK